MSRHEGVSCDQCLQGNFKGRRFKCLVCYDYDLCSSCFESGVATARHAASHPMQCILTRSDHDLYFGGETSLAAEHQHSFTCPFCSKMGFTESTLQEHVSSQHLDASQEVVCPICASFPGGDPNHVTDDFHGHLNLEHRGGARDLISFLDEPGGVHRQGAVRRIAHGRGGLTHRSRRHNVPPSGGPASLSTLSPSARDAVDPIAELLSQLSGARRAAGSSSSQLQQLQMELQLQRQQAQQQRQTLDRLARRPAGGGSGGVPASAEPQRIAAAGGAASLAAAAASSGASEVQSKSGKSTASSFLLTTLSADDDDNNEGCDNDEGSGGSESASRSRFIQELVLSTLALDTLDLETVKSTPAAAAAEDEDGLSGVKKVSKDKKS